MRRTILLFTAVLMLGAGCLPAGRQAPSAFPIDDTPESNPQNCEISGGTILDGVCTCPEGYSADPADFCLDAEGVPGGEMKPE